MNLSDILGLGKILPVDKLINILSKATGRVTKQYFDKKDVDTKAYEIQKLAEARAVEMKILTNAVKENFSGTGGIDYKDEKIEIYSTKQLPEVTISQLPSEDLVNRTIERLLYQQAKKQLNIESITSAAAEQLKDEPEVENIPLDEDWLNRFFNFAEDISTEEVQMLWGKILAGEIKKPKSFSVRTLEVIRSLTKEEADIVMKVSQFAFSFNNNYALFKGNENLLDRFGITFHDIALMTELGILQASNFVGFDLAPNNRIPTKNPFIFGSKVVVVSRIINASHQNIPIHIFSKAGIQILKLVETNPPFEYIREFAKYLKRVDTQVQYANINKVENSTINHSLPLMEFPDI